MGLEPISTGGSGSTDTYVTDTNPSNPNEGDEWVDTTYKQPAKKVWDGNNWVLLVEGKNTPRQQTVTSNTTLDVSDADETIGFELRGGQGKRTGVWGDYFSTGNTLHNYHRYFLHEGGKGASVFVNVNLTEVDTIDVNFHEASESEKIQFGWEYNDDTYVTAKGGKSVTIDFDGQTVAAGGGPGIVWWHYYDYNGRGENNNYRIESTGGGYWGGGARKWDASRDAGTGTVRVSTENEGWSLSDAPSEEYVKPGISMPNQPYITSKGQYNTNNEGTAEAILFKDKI